MRRAWNERVNDTATDALHGRPYLQLTYKDTSHLQAYQTKLMLKTRQIHASSLAAAAAAATGSAVVEGGVQQRDLELVLREILAECVVKAGDVSDLPPFLQALANILLPPEAPQAAAVHPSVVGTPAEDDTVALEQAAAPSSHAAVAEGAVGSATGPTASAAHAVPPGRIAEPAATTAAAPAAADAASAAAAAASAAAAAAAPPAAVAAAAAPLAPAAAPPAGVAAVAAPAGAPRQQLQQGQLAPISKKTKQPTLFGVGKGKGGAGGGKACVPCTLVALKLTSASAAAKHPNAIRMTGDHQKPPTTASGCKYCKCSDCKKEWSKENVQAYNFTLAVNCVRNRHYQAPQQGGVQRTMA